MRSILILLAGCGRFGFGDGARDDATRPHACTTQISAGSTHTCALRGDGTIRCWGGNADGEIGTGTFAVSVPLPMTVLESIGGPPFGRVTQISMGQERASCARRDDGTAWCWGDNSNGQVGDGTMIDQPSPTQVLASPGVPLTDVAEVYAGETHACARTTDGALWCWGDNSGYELGDGGVVPSSFPVRVLTATGPLSGVIGAHLGATHTVAWGPGGQLFTWGRGVNGVLGNGSMMDEPVATTIPIAPVVSAGGGCCHTCASIDTKYAYCFGKDFAGQLGDGATVMQTSPVLVLDAPGGSPFLVDNIVAGDNHTCALRADQTLWCWGNNGNGQLGNGDLAVPNLVSPARIDLPTAVTVVAAGNDHTCALLADDTIRCWGLNLSGELGNGGFTDTATPTPVMAICP